MKKWNHYICRSCGKTTVARHDDEGVTPFLIACRASEKACRDLAQSSFFECDQSDDQVPHVIFYRPPSTLAAIGAINKEPKEDREWLLEHYKKGGALMKTP